MQLFSAAQMKMSAQMRVPFEAESSHAVVSFNDIVKGSTRSQAAKCFFDLLVLKTRNEIRIKQEAIPEGYGPIKVMLA